MIGMDTSAIIDFFRGDEKLKNLLDNLDEVVALNQISYLEIMFGLDLDNRLHKIEAEFYDRLFESLANFNLNSHASKIASKILWSLRKDGKVVEKFDCIIAGIYLANGITKIITRNVRHFGIMPGVEVVAY